MMNLVCGRLDKHSRFFPIFSCLQKQNELLCVQPCLTSISISWHSFFHLAVLHYIIMKSRAAPGSDITLCFKIDKPLVAYRF